jgi:hypothetical protein
MFGPKVVHGTRDLQRASKEHCIYTGKGELNVAYHMTEPARTSVTEKEKLVKLVELVEE